MFHSSPLFVGVVIAQLTRQVGGSRIGSEAKCLPVESFKGPCGKRAQFRYTSREESFSGGFAPAIVASVEECAALCARRVVSPKHHQDESDSEWCHAFYFDTMEKLCQLGVYPISQSGIVYNQHSHRTFYDAGCYNCGAFCDQPYGANLLDNGDFEGKLLGPWESDSGGIGKGHKSSRAFNCAKSYGNHGDCSLLQYFNLCDGESYLLQYDYLFAASPSRYKARLSANIGYIPGFSLYVSQTIDNDTVLTWSTVRGYFRTNGRHYGPEFVFGGDLGPTSISNTFIDNVKVARVPKPKFKPKANSALHNGGFESGSLKPWKAYKYHLQGNAKSTFQVVPSGLNGSSYAVQFAAVDRRTYPVCGQLIQIVNTKPNTVYAVSFDILTQGSHQDEWYITLSTNADGEEQIEQFYTSAGQSSFSMPIYAKSNLTKFKLECENSDLDYLSEFKKATITFDNFAMREPSNGPFL